GSGWGVVVASLENVSGSVRRGTITLRGAMPWGNGNPSVTTHAPFSVAPGRTAIVKLPTHGLAYQSPTYTVDVVSDSGVLLASITLPSNPLEVPLLVDVDEPSRLAVAMRNWPLSLAWVPVGAPGFSYGSAARTTTLAIGSPRYDSATGDPILPDHPADYSSATVVLIHSDTLARLDAVALQALADWVISGGTIAIVPARADDLRGGALSAFIGGTAITTPPPPVLLSLPTVPRPPSSGTFPTPTLDDDSPLRFEAPTGKSENPFLPIVDVSINSSGSPYFPVRAVAAGHGPTPAIRATLNGYSGGNLTPSVFGASAAYGSGEVHLLPFDPTVSPLVDDPWIQSRVVDLVSHAWDRRAVNAIVLGSGQSNMGDLEAMRKALDPNENFRPALAIAALLLILYSIVSGPIVFMQATKRARPLAPLKWAPIASAVMFATLVVVGLAGKGWRGRARHMTFIEAGAGVSRGAVRRFRGFFTSDTRKLSVEASAAESVLEISSSDSTDKSELVVGRGGITIENVVSLPWQTIVVREDSVADLKNGVSVLTNPDGSIDVVNHTGRELDDVMVYAPKDGVHYFASLKDGARTNSTTGLMLVTTPSRPVSSTSSMVVHSLDTATLGASLDPKARARVQETWSPIGSALGQSVDWFPDDVPIVLAVVKGGEGAKRDSGLNVESDRLLLRIVGRGGAP
ncbi:MAG: hypothetical protein ABI183_09870, partial [Polyangiaceae bacterium]